MPASVRKWNKRAETIQLSPRSRTILHVIEYFVKSLKVIRNDIFDDL